MTAGLEITAEQQHRRQVLSRTWAVIVIAWAFGRTLLVWAAVGDYGINPWWYLLIDVICAAIDAVTTPKTVLALIDTEYMHAVKWGTASLVAFLLPDVYIFFATDHLPHSIIFIICGVVLGTLTFTLIGIRRKVRAGRSARGPAATPRASAESSADPFA